MNIIFILSFKTRNNNASRTQRKLRKNLIQINNIRNLTIITAINKFPALNQISKGFHTRLVK